VSRVGGIALDTLRTIADELSGCVLSLELMPLVPGGDNAERRDGVTLRLANARKATVRLAEIIKREEV
jgi:hypothetical protein